MTHEESSYSMSKTTKAIIFCGGYGIRLSEITQGQIPKGFIKFCGIPLVIHQIKILSDAGIKHFIITLNSNSDNKTFHSFINNQKSFNNLNIQTCISNPAPVNGHSHGFNIFKQKRIFDIIGDSDVLLVNADTIFLQKDIEKLIEQTLDTNVIATTYNKLDETEEKFRVENECVKFVCNDVSESNITGIAFFTNALLPILHQVALKSKPHIHTFLNKMIRDQVKIKVLRLTYYVNMNTIIEYNDVKLYFETKFNEK